MICNIRLILYFRKPLDVVMLEGWWRLGTSTIHYKGFIADIMPPKWIAFIKIYGCANPTSNGKYLSCPQQINQKCIRCSVQMKIWILARVVQAIVVWRGRQIKLCLIGQPFWVCDKWILGTISPMRRYSPKWTLDSQWVDSSLEHEWCAWITTNLNPLHTRSL